MLNFTITGWYNYFDTPEMIRDRMFGISVSHYLVQSLLVVVYLIDLLPFVLGYMLESDDMDNRIKSVDTSGFAWFICLVCYNPFSYGLNTVFPIVVPEYVEPFKELGTNWQYVHYVLNACAVFCLTIYAFASVSFGLKASNMTWLASRGFS